jgi:drug/metabolite transporter (DMT)-like permease
MLAVTFGLLAGAFYGSADFLGGLASKRAPMAAVTLTSQSIGLLCLLAILPFFKGHLAPVEIAWSLGGGICGAAGIALLYHALAIGKMSVVSPITAVLAASFPVIASLVRGDPLQWVQGAGIAAALSAVVMISASKESSGRREIATAGVKEAIASGIFIGAFFMVLGLSSRSAGLDTLLCARVGSVVALFSFAMATRTRLWPGKGASGMAVVSGIIDMTANVLFVLAAQTGALAIAAVLTSLYPAATVFLARLVLAERLQTIQKIGVGLALIGVALIAA